MDAQDTDNSILMASFNLKKTELGIWVKLHKLLDAELIEEAKQLARRQTLGRGFALEIDNRLGPENDAELSSNTDFQYYRKLSETKD